MHPDQAWSLCTQRREELAADIRRHRPGLRRGLPRLKVSWTALSPRDVAGAASQPRSWAVIISATRPG